MRFIRDLSLTLLMLTLTGALVQAQTSSGYKVTRRVSLGGEGGWDYLTFDTEARRLYVARATRVMVIDVDAGKPIGEIPNTLGVHGVALVHKLGRGVTSNGRNNTATIFDLKTLTLIATVKTGGKPDAILFDSFSGFVLTLDGASNDTTLIDPEKAVVVGAIALPGRPETGVSDGQGKVFVNLEDKNSIAVIDMKARKVVATWTLDGCEEPTGLAYDSPNRRLFSGCHNSTLVVLDADSGKNIQKLTIGNHVDAVAYNEQRKLVFTSNGEGNISVIQQESADRYSSYKNVPTAQGAKTLALDPDKHRLYTVANVLSPESPVKGTFHFLVIEQ